jgi:iron(III) transport system substrate-binding protein
MKAWSFRLILVLLALVPQSGCWTDSGPKVVVYTALDSEFSEPIFEEFSSGTGVAVLPKFDTEATKTVGLVEAIIAEGSRPQCDVFWNNEILNTLRLEKRGLLQPFQPDGAGDYPAMYRSANATWYGFAARARVLVVNTELVSESERPGSIQDLASEDWRGQTAIAKPLFGTTATHVACLFACWGEDRAKEFFRKLKENEIQIHAGNKQVALAVAAGRAAFGLTDTDDAIIEMEKGLPVTIVYPDQGDEGMGTLFIPNTLAIVAGCRNPKEARRLVEYLLSPGVEAKLAEGPSAQIPLNPKTKASVQVETPQTAKAMDVDFEAAAGAWESARQFIRNEFTR